MKIIRTPKNIYCKHYWLNVKCKREHCERQIRSKSSIKRANFINGDNFFKFQSSKRNYSRPNLTLIFFLHRRVQFSSTLYYYKWSYDQKRKHKRAKLFCKRILELDPTNDDAKRFMIKFTRNSTANTSKRDEFESDSANDTDASIVELE